MKRRLFVRRAAAIAPGALLGAAACTKQPGSQPAGTGAAKQTHDWRLVLAVPKTLPIWGPGVERFAERVRAMSDGALKIQVYGAGELVPALGVFDAVSAGQV